MDFFSHNFAKGLSNNRPDIIESEEKAIEYDETGINETGDVIKGGIPSLSNDEGAFHPLDVNLDPYDEERLHLCVKNMYKLRLPSDNLYVNNLAIVGAHTQCTTYYVSTMESAAESGRRGANAIFKNDHKSLVKIFTEVQLPWYVKASRVIDRGLYKCKLGNPLRGILNLFRKAKTTDAHINTIVYSATNFGNNSSSSP